MVESVKPEIHVCRDLHDSSSVLAKNLVNIAQDRVSKRDRFTLALSGGKTPRLLYSLLAGEYSNLIPWSAVHLFWGDERCVPQDHPDSNFALAYQTFIRKVPITQHNIHRIPAEIKPAEKAAEAYERLLREVFKGVEGDSLPLFDVILLGVGEDGHTASLFPGSPALQVKDHWAVAVEAPLPFSPKKRITLTLPVINRSGVIFFFVSGAEKSRVVKFILKEPAKARKFFPAAMVSPRNKIIWYISKVLFDRSRI